MSTQTKAETETTTAENSEKVIQETDRTSSRWPSYANPLAVLGLLLGVVILNPWDLSSPSSVLLDVPFESSFQPESQKPIVPYNLADKYRDSCPDHQFKSVRLISRSPEIMIIDGFLTEEEADALIRMADPKYQDSAVVGDDDITVSKEHRSSRSAYLDIPANPPQTDDEIILSCIEQRAARFQGHIPRENMENLQIVRYIHSQEFRAHFDWLEPQYVEDLGGAGNRLTSFFVYLLANCTGGSTVFPELAKPESAEWCGTVKCHDEEGQEIQWLEVPPKVGSAIFWYNLDLTGQGDRKTLHAGMPVIEGTKVGLNIWTRERRYRHENY